MKLKYYKVLDDDIASVYIDFCCITPASILEVRYNSVCRDLVLRMVDKLGYKISNKATEMSAGEFLATLVNVDVHDKEHKSSVLATVTVVINSFEPTIADVKLGEPLKEEKGGITRVSPFTELKPLKEKKHRRFVEANPLDMFPSKVIEEERRKKNKYKLKLLKLKLKLAELQKNG